MGLSLRHRRWQYSMVAFGLLSLCLVLVNTSQAAAPPELLRFPPGSESGEAGGELRLPAAVAVNETSGHLYVGENGNARISEFDSQGEFVRAWGWGVVASGPDDNPQNERQELVVTATGGEFELIFQNPFGDGATEQKTASIPFDSSAALIQERLEDLPSPVPGDFAVTGSAGGPWIIEFDGKYADTNLSPFKLATAGLTGTAEVKTLQQGANFEVCEAAAGDGCRAGQRNEALPGQLRGGVHGLAVDQSGRVYVFEERAEPEFNARIQRFSATGEFEMMMGGEVNKTTGANVCTKADLEGGDECGAGVPGNGPGEFTLLIGLEQRLAVGPDGLLYVGDENRIQEFEPDGSFKGEIPITGSAQYLDVDSAGNFYVTYFGQANVHKLTPGGLGGTPASFAVSDPQAIAVDPEGGVWVVNDPFGFGTPSLNPRLVKFDAAGNKLIPTPEEEAKNQFFAQRGNFDLTGLAISLCPGGDSPGALYVSDLSGHVSAYGKDPGCDISPPKVTERYAAAVSTEEATIATRINPNGNPTTFYVEYGTEPCDVSTCAQVPAVPGKSLEDEGSSPVLREVGLSGLEPGTTYHYRVVAIGAAVMIESSEATLTTRKPGTEQLPDERAYEMVSPAEKNSADIAPQGGISNFLMQAAESGPRLVYPSSTPFADPESAPPSSVYRGIRGNPGSEWLAHNISPQGAALEQQVKAISADLGTAVIVSSEPPLCCGATNGIKNLYLRDLDSGTYTLLTTEEPRLTIPQASYCVGIQGFTPDFSRVFFKANGALTDDAPEGAGASLYEWTKADGIGLVSVLPGEVPASPTAATSLGRPAAGLAPFCEADRILDDAVSADGSHVVWTSGSALYDRINGGETVQLDLPQGGPGASGTGTYWAASEDGSKVFFTASSALTAGAHAEDLYRYDFDQPPGSRLVDLTTSAAAANVRGVVGASEAGDAIYFVATGVLAENGGAAVDSKGDPQKAKGGQNNLYLWREGSGIRFIGRFAPNLTNGEPTSDASAWDASPQARNASVSADGNELAITSVEPLSGYENTAQGSGEQTRQVYLYDATEDELTCVSCNPTWARPLGPQQLWESSSEQPGLTGWKTAFAQPRYLSADGQRLFFESFDALVAEDHNQARDVYEFERPGKGDCAASSPTYWSSLDGCVDLVSSAPAASNSFFLDASADGQETYISTAAQLVGIDTDEKFDAYDVKVGGQGQVEPEPPVACNGTTIPCPRDKQNPPVITPPSSGPPIGSGNVPTKTCPKGKVLRKGKCVRKPCPKGKVRRRGSCVKKHNANHRKHRVQRQGR